MKIVNNNVAYLQKYIELKIEERKLAKINKNFDIKRRGQPLRFIISISPKGAI